MAIPHDLSVVGFDNQEIVAEALSPALTTLALPYYEMGAVAVDILVAELKGEPLHTPRQMSIASAVVRRESIRRLGLSP